MTRPRFNRILLKLSGEALMGQGQFGIDPQAADGLAGEITFREDHTLARSNFIVLEGKGGAWALAQY